MFSITAAICVLALVNTPTPPSTSIVQAQTQAQATPPAQPQQCPNCPNGVCPNCPNGQCPSSNPKSAIQNPQSSKTRFQVSMEKRPIADACRSVKEKQPVRNFVSDVAVGKRQPVRNLLFAPVRLIFGRRHFR